MQTWEHTVLHTTAAAVAVVVVVVEQRPVPSVFRLDVPSARAIQVHGMVHCSCDCRVRFYMNESSDLGGRCRDDIVVCCRPLVWLVCHCVGRVAEGGKDRNRFSRRHCHLSKQKFQTR